MTNFEYMKKTVSDTIAALDEGELRQLVSDTCMDGDGADGIFDCGLCGEVYGDCDTLPGGNGCMKKYLDWCARKRGSGPEAAREDKKDILSRLKFLLAATRAGSGIKDLVLSEDENRVTVQFEQGGRVVDVECDSGYAMIMDVLRAL